MCVEQNDKSVDKFDTYDIRQIDFEMQVVEIIDTVYAYVDLGLPSGTLWATFNVGASRPEEFGDYFAWGETEPKEVYDNDSYEWYKSNGNEEESEYLEYTKYNDEDMLKILRSEDDVASVKWGSDWRMPTMDEYNELVSNCEKITYKRINGISGTMFTAKNGNWIFFPDAGYRDGDSFEKLACVYWSSSSHLSGKYADCQNFGGVPDKIKDCRHAGFSVRPVYVKRSDEIKEPLDTTRTILSIDTTNFMCVKPYDGIVKKYNVEDVEEVFHEEVILPTDTSSYDYPYVDLGLPSGTLWATFNVGASKPEEYGDYFAWGEIKTKNYYDWTTYRWGGEYGTSKEYISKYCCNHENGRRDSLVTLLPEDDAATANWGQNWRMPTVEECCELIENCQWSWEELNGVKGTKITAKNGNWIFFPAAGTFDGYSVKSKASEAYYLSSSLHVVDWSTVGYSGDDWYSCCLYFYDVYYQYCSTCARFSGHTVRPVRAKK